MAIASSWLPVPFRLAAGRALTAGAKVPAPPGPLGPYSLAPARERGQRGLPGLPEPAAPGPLPPLGAVPPGVRRHASGRRNAFQGSGGYLSVAPSTHSRSRSACPLCWAYSSIMCTTTARTDMVPILDSMVSSYDTPASTSVARRHSSSSRA